MSIRGHCPACQCEHHVATETTGKMVGTAIGVAIGHSAHKSPWASLIGALAGAVAGEVIDRAVIPRCPTCQTALRLIGASLT
jgi:uncharacterized protein YcfJ